MNTIGKLISFYLKFDIWEQAYRYIQRNRRESSYKKNKILKNVNLFDEYKEKNIGDKKKSFAVSFTFNDSKKTLTDKIIDKVMIKLADKYITELGAVLRDK